MHECIHPDTFTSTDLKNQQSDILRKGEGRTHTHPGNGKTNTKKSENLMLPESPHQAVFNMKKSDTSYDIWLTVRTDIAYDLVNDGITADASSLIACSSKIVLIKKAR